MRRLACLTLLLAAISVPSAHASGNDQVVSALPAGARLLLDAAIPGFPGHYAVVYSTGHPYLGVVSTASGNVTWNRLLPGEPDFLAAPGPAGLFEARISATATSPAYFLAFSLTQSKVQSAIASHSGGTLKADDGFVVRKSTVTARSRDLGHQGEVRYRFVSRFEWIGQSFVQTLRYRVPDYPPGHLPAPGVLVATQSGDRILVVVEVANTEQKRQTGLMYRHQLDPDAGMIFVWQQPVLESFWMENTYIPLSIAFIAADGTIQEMQDMAPLTEVAHTPGQPYLMAIEVNQGFFRQNGIVPGDHVALHLTGASAMAPTHGA